MSDPELIDGSMLPSPLFKDPVQMIQIELQQISQERKALRSRKILKLS